MKKVFLGLFVAVIAFSASAFTIAFEPQGTVYGQTSLDTYTKRVNPYNSASCSDTDPDICAYIVTELGAQQGPTYGTSLSASEISAGIAAGYLVAVNDGIYSGS